MTQTLFTDAPIAPIPANGTVAVVVDVIVPPEQAVAQLTHRIAYELRADAPARTALENFAVDGPALAVSPQPHRSWSRRRCAGLAG